jgi:transcriptional regulator with XRE-family HTH domain
MAREIRDVLREFGLRLGELRRARGLTQEAVAERLGMLAPNYARVEQGRANVTVDTLNRIAGALGTDIAELFGRAASHAVRLGRPPKALPVAAEASPVRKARKRT